MNILFEVILTHSFCCCFLFKGDEGFGVRDPNCEMTEEEMEKVDLSKFDESDSRQLQIKLMVGYGSFFGFRGNEEHAMLSFSQIGSGTFPANHPTFPSIERRGLTLFANYKTQKLYSSNSHVRVLIEALG